MVPFWAAESDCRHRERTRKNNISEGDSWGATKICTVGKWRMLIAVVVQLPLRMLYVHDTTSYWKRLQSIFLYQQLITCLVVCERSRSHFHQTEAFSFTLSLSQSRFQPRLFSDVNTTQIRRLFCFLEWILWVWVNSESVAGLHSSGYQKRNSKWKNKQCPTDKRVGAMPLSITAGHWILSPLAL